MIDISLSSTRIYFSFHFSKKKFFCLMTFSAWYLLLYHDNDCRRRFFLKLTHVNWDSRFLKQKVFSKISFKLNWVSVWFLKTDDYSNESKNYFGKTKQKGIAIQRLHNFEPTLLYGLEIKYQSLLSLANTLFRVNNKSRRNRWR